MNTTTNTIKSLAEWIEQLKELARGDSDILISWFKGTKNEPFSVIGGWMEGFSESYSDLFCMSKTQPTYAMCVKIAINDGPYAYTDFEMMNMPYDDEGNVDDTCVALEWEDDPEELATWLLAEWERIMKECEAK
jgi:hypothetical protein